MAVRAPLKLDSNNNFVEMSSTEIAAIVDQAKYLYGTAPSVTIARDSNGANMGAINDTRLQAGASTTDVTNFDNAAETPNISTISTGYNLLELETFPHQMTTAILSKIVNVSHNFRSWVEESVGGRARGDITNDGSVSMSDVTAMLRYEQGLSGTTEINYVESYLLNLNTEDSNNIKYPVYQDGGNIKAMSLDDMYDTFIYPAIDELTDGSDQPGTFRIHTANSLSGHTLMHASPVFIDKRADVSEYTAAGIGEAQDQPETISSYYLFRTNAGNAVSYVNPVYIRSDNNLQQYTTSNFDVLLKQLIQHGAGMKTGSIISYNLNGTGNNRGSGMVDTILNGTGNYQTRFVNANDYRTQEFPNGSAVTASTTFLRITQV